MANVAPTSLVPEATLRRLTPRREGTWHVLGQAADHFTLAYVMDGGAHALTYQMYPCNNEEETIQVCGQLIYSYPGHSIPPPGNNTVRRSQSEDLQPLHLVLRPRQENIQDQGEVMQDLSATDPSSNTVQNQMIGDPQSGMAVQSQDQFAQSQANGQDQQQRNMDWEEVSAGVHAIFSGILNNQSNNSFNTIAPGNIIGLDDTTIGPVFNGGISTGDIALPGSDTHGEIDWSMFTDT